jgi:hypothetical protein
LQIEKGDYTYASFGVGVVNHQHPRVGRVSLTFILSTSCKFTREKNQVVGMSNCISRWSINVRQHCAFIFGYNPFCFTHRDCIIWISSPCYNIGPSEDLTNEPPACAMPAVAITIAPAISTWHMIEMVAKS